MRCKDRFLQGEFPEKGAIFMSNSRTKKECLRRSLFGLPIGSSDFVLRVKRGMILFLFEYERRLLYGVYRATSDGEMNIEPRAFKSSGSYFPAQVRFTTVCDCSPLSEYEFQDAIKDNYFSEKKFRFGLNKDQVSKLMKLFHYKKISKRHPERHNDKPAERVSRFGNIRKGIRDRLRFVDKADSRDVRISEFGDNEAEEVDDRVYSTKKMIEGRKKDDRDEVLTNYITRKVDSGDCGTRRDTLGKHLDHYSLGELRRVADVNLDYMGDVMDRCDTHYRFEELRGITNTGSFSMMDNIKSEPDIEDGYIPIFTKPHENHYGEIDAAHNDAKILIDAKDKDILDYTRLQDEYNVRASYRQSLSAYRMGIPCGVGSQTIADRYFLGHETVGSDVDNAISFSQNNQNTFLTSGETRIGIPEIQLNPSYLADESNFIPLDNGPYHPSSTEVPSFLPLSASPPRRSHNEEPIRYFDDLSYASMNKRQITGEGNRVCETASLDGLHSPLFPDFVSKRLFSSNAGLCKLEENTIDNYAKRSRQPRKSKHRFGTDKRVSVFARLNSSLKHDKEEFKTNKIHELDASVDKVMEMLEKVVSTPKREGKINSVTDKDDKDKRRVRKIADYVFPEVEMELDADQEDEETKGGSELRETRLLDFKRRKKAKKCIDDASKEKSEFLVAAASDVKPTGNNHVIGVRCKRRKLVRSAFVEKKATNDISANNDADILTPNVDNISTKEVLENTLSNNDCDSTKTVALESLAKVDTSIKINMLPNTRDVAPSKEDNSSTAAVLESSEKVDAFTESMEDISMLPIPLVTTLSKDDCDATEVVHESPDKVDASIESVQPSAECQKGVNSEECSPVEGDGNAEKREVADVFVQVAPVASLEDQDNTCGWIEW